MQKVGMVEENLGEGGGVTIMTSLGKGYMVEGLKELIYEHEHGHTCMRWVHMDIGRGGDMHDGHMGCMDIRDWLHMQGCNME